jgi:NAD(P)-dependent dehydrogenase (short-subunit alcohol dehydrogenase family)
MGSLDGRVAIVTGAGSGVGRCHALALAAEGAAVVVNDLGDAADDTVAAIVDAGGSAVAHHGSVADWATGDELVAAATGAFGDLHILVNNAGITRDAMSFSMTEQDWDLVIDVHLKGHFVCARAAGAYWRNQSKEGIEGPRRLIHTTSESGLFGSAGQGNYGAAKGGILTMSLVFGRELGKYGVTTNVIAPRARTPMTQHTASMAAPEDPDAFDTYAPDNVSPFVAWLCTDDAADVTGQTFIVGGSGVWRMQPFSHLASLELTGKRLTVAEISARRDELFADVDPGLPPFQAPKFG